MKSQILALWLRCSYLACQGCVAEAMAKLYLPESWVYEALWVAEAVTGGSLSPNSHGGHSGALQMMGLKLASVCS